MKAVVESGALDAGKVQTVFAALRVWEVPLSAAYAAQALVALVVAATVGWLGWTRPRSAALGPALVAGTLLMSPYMLDYDLVLCAIPLAWLLSQGIATGFRRWEKAVMLTAYVLPLVARLLASQAHLPLAPLVLMALFALVVRRAADPQPVADSRRADHSMLSAA
jgi:alpha-1,2-mannosyltransferase